MKNFLINITLLLSLFLTNTALASDANVVSIDLEESIHIALENNHSIKQSMERQAEAKWSLSEAKRQTGLNLKYEFSGKKVGGNRKHKDYQDDDYDRDFSHSATISIPIYSGGRLEGEQRSAQFALNSADIDLEKTRQDVKFQTTKAYYNVLLCREMIIINEEAVTILEEYLKKANAQFELGRAARSDILASTVQLANAKKNLRTAQGNYDKSMAELNNIMGLPVQTQLAIHDQLHYSKYDLNIDDCIAYALENRPDYAAANYEVKQAKAEVGVAKSDFLPQINAEANRTNAGDGMFKTDHERSWSAGIMAKWNIFDNGITNARVREKVAELHKAEDIANEISDKIKLEVHSIYIDLLAEEDNIKIISTAVSQAEEECTLAQVRYVEGIGTNLSVMNAQEKLAEARTSYYTSLFKYSTAKAALDKAMGIPVELNIPRYQKAA